MWSEQSGITVRHLSAATIAIFVWSVTGYDVISDPDCLDPDSHYPAVIEPTQVRIREGASLNITCKVEARCRSRYNATDLYILKTVPEFYINSTRVHLLSSSAIQLRLAVTREEPDRGIWMCLVRGLPGRGLIKYTSHVQFVKFPLVPEIVSCIVDNWETLTCRWTPSYYQQLTHTMEKNFVYKFIYSRRSTTASYCCSDSNTSFCQHKLTDNFCRLHRGSKWQSFEMGAIYNLTIRAETSDAFQIGQWVNFNTSLNVRPGAPEQVTMTAHNRSHYSIVWLPPGSAWEEAKEWTFNCSVTVSTKYESQTFYTIDTQYLLPVRPYTKYNVRIRICPIQGGFWSEESIIQVLTQIREPDINPVIFASGYEVIGTPCTDTCDVRVYWQPLYEWQLGGSGFSYKILTREMPDDEGMPGNWSVIKSISDYRQNTESIAISARKTTQVTIVASNVLGDAGTKAGVLWIQPSNLAINITERLILECAGVNMYGWLEGATSATTNSAIYVLFWQNKETKYHNYRRVGWMPLVKNGSNTYRTTVQLSDPCHQYEYSLSKAVTVNGAIHTSGLVRYTDCIYANGADQVSPPTDVQIIDRSRNTLSVSWRKPHCDVSTAYIGSYHVYYCEKDQRFNNCKDPLFRVEMKVSGDVTRLTLRNLQADTSYLVYVSSQAYHGDNESVRVMATGPSRTLPGLSVGVIVGLLFICVMAVVITGVVIRLYWRGCVRLKRWYTKGIVITMPRESSNHVSVKYEAIITSNYQEEHQPYNSSSRNIFRGERKQNGLYTRSNFLLKSPSDSGHFSAVVSDIYGMDTRRDGSTRCHNASLYNNQFVSSGNRARSPQPIDRGSVPAVISVSDNPNISRYARAAYSPEHLPGFIDAATSDTIDSCHEDATKGTVTGEVSDESAARVNCVNWSEKKVHSPPGDRKIIDCTQPVTEIIADHPSVGQMENYVTEVELLRLTDRRKTPNQSLDSPIQAVRLESDHQSSRSSEISGYVPCFTGADSNSGYIDYQEVASTINKCLNTSPTVDENQDTWTYVSHDFINT